MDDVFNWFENLFVSESSSKGLFTGSETHIIIVMNDDINSMGYIIDKFVSILGISREKAVKLMWRIHNEGIAVVWTGSSSEAEQYLPQLKEAGLKSCVAQYRSNTQDI